ncbi:WD40-repeat-containing domain protein [Achaetomium macrosporum]|uniref:WD40-repeat-containing domain protein n=1 Tax=Achaetomium macrosporum TaxID=79813 RepID=A0AAN7CIW9_9PEZI|nr:WD40-repeat-containing domain protein [Achaetomium macrosporum]
MSKAAAFLNDPPAVDDRPSFETIIKHGHQDLVQAVAFNGHGDRCATGSVDGRIRVFNRHKDGTWRLCDTWAAHASEILEIQWLPTIIYPNLLASLGIEGRFKLWAEDPSAAQGRRFSESTRSGPLITIPARSLYPHATTSNPGLPTTGPGSPAPVPPPSSDTAAGGGGAGGGGSAPQVKPAFETRNPRSPYRSFSIKHLDDSHITYLALLSADGSLTVYENERVENLAQFTLLDEFSTTTTTNTSIISFSSTTTTTTPITTSTTGASTATTATGGGGGGGGAAAAATTGAGAGAAGEESQQRTPPVAARGEETSFRVRFDPNPEVCYTALRAGVPSDALGLVVAVMDTVRVYRTRDMIRTSLGVAAAWKGFYLAAEVVGVHRGLVRDVAWAPGNIRGYDVIATACQDGFVRVFRLDAVPSSPEREDGEGEGERGKWAAERVKKHAPRRSGEENNSGTGTARASLMASSAIRAGLDPSRENLERRTGNLPGRIRHVMTEISKLDSHRTPVWRVGFDDDGQILGSVGDEGKLMCYRQKPDGTWAKSSEMAMVKMKMAAP